MIDSSSSQQLRYVIVIVIVIVIGSRGLAQLESNIFVFEILIVDYKTKFKYKYIK